MTCCTFISGSRVTPQFGLDLVTVMAGGGGEVVPALVTRCVTEVDRRGLTVPGIYRATGLARRKDALRRQLETNVYATDLSSTAVPDIHDVTGYM